MSQLIPKKKYKIILPPPNVTGILHMGHAFQQTLMDILARYHRLQGDEVEWIPGVDHAGIAGQLFLQRNIHNHRDLPADKLRTLGLDICAKVKDKIQYQMKRLLISADWGKERFTLDPDFNIGVREAFIKLYQSGIIYRGDRITYLDPVLQTCISDSEVIFLDKTSNLWTIAYPLVGENEVIEVSTTRPETLFGDTAIVCHPDDARYTKLVGKFARVPLTDRHIPIVASSEIEMSFGTGCLKLTPSCSAEDYAIAQKHDLPMLSIFDSQGTLNTNVPEDYQGCTSLQARTKVIDALQELGYLMSCSSIQHRVPTGDKSQAVLEPVLTKQWFVRSKLLTPAVRQALLQGKVAVYPQQWLDNIYAWLDNIQDWCISRQIWWGHTIPAWYDDNNNVYVGNSEAEIRAQLTDPEINLVPETDVLDTWFSSAIWPLSIAGWPHKASPELPHTYLVTGFDIIFFWFIRMSMLTMYFTKTMPVTKLIITGLIRDRQGRKMSKSLGNVIDPMDLIDGCSKEELLNKQLQYVADRQERDLVRKDILSSFPEGIPAYGIDVVRLTFSQLSTPSVTASFDYTKLIGNKNFCHKLINAANFVKLSIDSRQHSSEEEECLDSKVINKWLNYTLAIKLTKTSELIKIGRFDLAINIWQDFLFGTYCSFYLELVKIAIRLERATVDLYDTLLHSMLTVIQSLYPFMPHTTLKLYQDLRPDSQGVESMMFDKPVSFLPQHDAEVAKVEFIINLIKAIRSLVTNNPHKQVILVGCNNWQHETCLYFKKYIFSLAGVEAIEYKAKLQNLKNLACLHVDNVVVYAQVSSFSRKHINSLNRRRQHLISLLEDPSFLDKAPKSVIEERTAELKAVAADLAEES